MDIPSRQALIRLVRDQRVASLGTIFRGSPLVSMVLFAATDDLSHLIIHVSRLAQHTQALLESDSGNVGLMIAEPDRKSRNPQTLARLAIQGSAAVVSPDDADYPSLHQSYLRKFPNAALIFELGDFLLVRIRHRNARLVTGFGRIFDLEPDRLTEIFTSGS
jgi:putative heme iron utilization protein